ncbi:HesB-like domain-containing protein [Cryptosporidium muris RN66]|uniref:HesB-like domain-containing protein n=1 Tax=Cryptosporidium muris (strain RN66) TaxID=441375 RepID=B6AJT8_CRYMR|nr:HesB-like domain-containing protein [Cryptosporidium muris RN66]EEA08479.1 HesB-like domain-containing protein [Cryptosporidium muris RN66]|eukprot:XP_002142828.1 HesB-like domain-containing protein [Cryptosporidium muris RN66]
MTAYLSTKSSEQQIAPNNILSITSKALLKLKDMLEEYKHRHNKKYVAIRLTLLKSGCSGYSYKLLFDDLYNNTENQTKNKECLINFKDDSGAKNIEVPIIIESNSLTTLFGTKIDFSENELDSQFTFYNKLHIGCCDCGKSYMFEDNKENIHHNIKTNYITKNNFVECI